MCCIVMLFNKYIDKLILLDLFSQLHKGIIINGKSGP